MTFSILTDDEIKSLLNKLTIDELESFRKNLRDALHEYSTGAQAPGQALIHQPERTVVRSGVTGATTLFMPSCSPAGHGVKVITLSSAEQIVKSTQQEESGQEASNPLIRPTGAITLFSPDGSPRGIVHASTVTAFRTALASLCLIHKRDHVKTITVFGCGEQAYWHVRLTLLLRGSTVKHVNVINRRFSPSCGAMLRRFYEISPDIKAREGWTDTHFGVLTPSYGEYERLLTDQVRSADVIFCCTPSTVPLFDGNILTERDARRKGRLIVAIGSYTPQMREVPVELIQQAIKVHDQHAAGKRTIYHHKHAVEGGVVVVDTLDGALKEAGELIEAGLGPRHLVELGELVMLHRIKLSEETDNGSSRASTDVDTDSLSASTSTLTLSSPPTEEKDSKDTEKEKRPRHSRHLSIQNLVRGTSRSRSRDSRKPDGSAETDTEREQSKKDKKKKKEKEGELARWLQKGNVIYKSVGLGLMDLTVGMQLVDFAEHKGERNGVGSIPLMGKQGKEMVELGLGLKPLDVGGTGGVVAGGSHVVDIAGGSKTSAEHGLGSDGGSSRLGSSEDSTQEGIQVQDFGAQGPGHGQGHGQGQRGIHVA
ncbi:hypothetical protein QBC32DRAFT_249947 [Pseudoneurospora amorphoporcata]|uniref:Uncharacterized protein n=1 Tax=Pseudoneurospora amorphoporcata TaxID=241081 RepID=A0AAN6P6Q3_9PEZI|nr:hypothetical protein QBC32DRAFT_249947 [Pseudoneurospora amorphoporcata]